MEVENVTKGRVKVGESKTGNFLAV